MSCEASVSVRLRRGDRQRGRDLHQVEVGGGAFGHAVGLAADDGQAEVGGDDERAVADGLGHVVVAGDGW